MKFIWPGEERTNTYPTLSEMLQEEWVSQYIYSLYNLGWSRSRIIFKLRDIVNEIVLNDIKDEEVLEWWSHGAEMWLSEVLRETLDRVFKK